MLLQVRWLLVGASLVCSAFLPAGRPPRLSPQAERDTLYAWLAYAVVLRDWQPTSQPDSSRGFNIGSVLVNPDGYVVHWARNAVNRTRNQTQHGEVRLVQSYLQRTRQFSLKGYTVYSTLEPCAMCAGMLTLTQVQRVVYGQRDSLYGQVFQRLQLDSRTKAGGYAPYPRAVAVAQAPDTLSRALDYAYRRHPSPTMVRFLATPTARRVYEQAAAQLATYRALYPENQARLDSARRLLAHVVRQADE